MDELEIATWTLTFLTGVLALSTIAYTIVTYMNYKGSKKHIEALQNMTNAILEAPKIAESMKTHRELTKKLNDEKSKQLTPQQKALKGR